MFFKILKVLKTITPLNKKTLNSNLLIFDCESLKNLETYVLKNFDYFVIWHINLLMFPHNTINLH